MKNYFKDWNTFEKVWLLAFTLVNIYLFFAWHDSITGLVASISGMLCVVLTAKGRISSFYWGLINIFAYSWVAYQSAYWGEVQLNMLFFLPMTFVGIYYWNRNQRKDKRQADIKVRSLTATEKFGWILLSAIAIVIYGFFLKYLNGTLPFMDATTTILSIVATIMLNKRLTDQWLYWITVDVVTIIMWTYIFITKGTDVSMLVMWSAFLVNAVYGYYNWIKMERNQNGK
ncbi:MAG: nicotinamide riboside transporter PnuC [archaeon]